MLAVLTKESTKRYPSDVPGKISGLSHATCGKWVSGQFDGNFIAVSPNGKYAYVVAQCPGGKCWTDGTNSDSKPVNGAVSVINTSTGSTIGSPITVGQYPCSVAVSPDGKFVYVPSGPQYDNGYIRIISTSTNSVVGTINLSGQLSTCRIVFSNDGRKAYVGDGYIINTSNNEFIGTPREYGYPDIIITPDGKYIYGVDQDPKPVGSIDVFDLTGSKVASIPLTGGNVNQQGNFPFAITIIPNGKYAYISEEWANQVIVIDTSTQTVVRTIPVGNYPMFIASSPDGKYIYVANEQDNNVSIISTATDTVIGKIAVPNPSAIATFTLTQ